MTAELAFMFVLGAAAGAGLASMLWLQKVAIADAHAEMMDAFLVEAHEEIDDLQAQVSRFDGDGDGRIGGSKPRKSH